MPVKHTYENIFNDFKNHNCELLYDKFEFCKIYINADSKLDIKTSCGHKYSISYHTFTRNKNNVICKNCRYNKLSEKQKISYFENKYKLTQLETDSIDYLKYLIDEEFEFKRTFEGCKADIAIKPKNIINDKWIGIQIKSTLNKVNKQNNIGYNFPIFKQYENMIIICIDYIDKKIWLFENNDIKHVKSTITIRNNSKYSKFEIHKETIISILLNKYEQLDKLPFNELDTPLSNTVKLEYKYRQLRENKLTFINFINNENQCEVYDFKIGNKKIQEKVSSVKNNKIESYSFNLHKMGSKKNGKRTRQNYKLGDCDIYWLHCKDTKKFYVIPENILAEKGYVGNSDGKPKSLIISKTNKNTFWSKDYLFDYDNLDKDKLCKILL